MAKQQIFKLENGSTLIYQKQSAFNGYSFAIGFRSGAQLDGKYKGLSHLLEHLLFRTTNPKSTNALLDNVLKYTINQNAYTSEDCICVTFSSVYKNVEQALAYVRDRLTNTSFTKSQIEKEIEVVKHEINLYKDANDYITPSALDCLLNNLIDDGAKNLNILGNSKTLNQITPNLLRTYVRRYFNLDNLIISVTTNKSLENVVSLCDSYIYSALKPAACKEYIVSFPKLPTVKNYNTLIANPDQYSKNISICLLLRERAGFAEDINLEYAYDVVEEYMMNSLGSLLWEVLRTKNQLVYSFNLSNLDYTNAKFKAFSAVTSPSKMRKTISEICKLIKNISLYGVPAKKFQDVKNALTDIKSATLQKFKNSNAETNFSNYLYGNEFLDYKKVNDYISKMTLEDFNNHIMSIYSMANVSVAVDGNFDTRKCYNLLEIEKMLGNYSHIYLKNNFNKPLIETSPIKDPNLDVFDKLKEEYIKQINNECDKKDTSIKIDNTLVK